MHGTARIHPVGRISSALSAKRVTLFGLKAMGVRMADPLIKMQYHRKLAQELHDLAAKEQCPDVKQRLLSRAQAYDELCERFLQRYTKANSRQPR